MTNYRGELLALTLNELTHIIMWSPPACAGGVNLSFVTYLHAASALYAGQLYQAVGGLEGGPRRQYVPIVPDLVRLTSWADLKFQLFIADFKSGKATCYANVS